MMVSWKVDHSGDEMDEMMVLSWVVLKVQIAAAVRADDSVDLME